MIGSNLRDNSLYVFPGRSRVRHGIDFDEMDSHECTKHYVKGNSYVPSFMTVQCACAHPKLIGFVILPEHESISAALSSLLTHFVIPPKRVWYDNGCNTFDCAINRIPWFLRWCMLLVDRFHFTGHTCSNIYNGDMHRIMDSDRSVAAEVINAVIDKGTSHINYLDGRNVIPFMRIVFAFLNAMAVLKDNVKVDLEDFDVMGELRARFNSICTTCTHEHEGTGRITVMKTSNVHTTLPDPRLEGSQDQSKFSTEEQCEEVHRSIGGMPEPRTFSC